jgi:hypothetical protein
LPCYPKAALFAFCVALVSYDFLIVVKAALRSAHGDEAVEEVSGYDLADEIAGTHRGMMIAIPEDEWVVFAGLTASRLGVILKGLAAKVRLSTLRKHRRGPKRPQPKRASWAKISHVSTVKLLAERKNRSSLHLQGHAAGRWRPATTTGPRSGGSRGGADVTAGPSRTSSPGSRATTPRRIAATTSDRPPRRPMPPGPVAAPSTISLPTN